MRPFRIPFPQLGTFLLFTLVSASPAQVRDPAPRSVVSANDEAREWFEDAKLGLFIHWSIDSLLGKGVVVMDDHQIPIAEYEKLPARFNPTDFDAETWVKMAKASGARYITVTSKHHDGFCMFDSKLTRYDVVDATPFARDPLKDLARACGKHGLKIFFYYSLLDWHHPDYFPRGQSGRTAGREEHGDWSRYIAYVQGQVREICTNYGPIGGIWFDGTWDRPDADWDLKTIYQIVHELQPHALVGNNHHGKPKPGEDIVRWEPHPHGGNRQADKPAQPMEFWLTLNNSYGHVAADKAFKSPEQLIHQLITTSGHGANLLLFIAPKPNGSFAPSCTERLVVIGQWLDKHGETVFTTRPGPIPPGAWGVSLRKGGKNPLGLIYLHVTNPKAPIELPGRFLSYDARVYGASGFLNTFHGDGLFQIELPEDKRMTIDTVIVLTPKILSPERGVRR